MIEAKIFTVQEAADLIPELTSLMETLRERQERIDQKEVEIDALELIADTHSGGGPRAVETEIEVMDRLIQDFNQIVDSIHHYGCFLKDVEVGLVDFYALLDNQIVFLCWKYGETEIHHWHEVGQGYGARRPLPGQ
jgi:hypothetical protein